MLHIFFNVKKLLISIEQKIFKDYKMFKPERICHILVPPTENSGLGQKSGMPEQRKKRRQLKIQTIPPYLMNETMKRHKISMIADYGL